ncbi:hypothetical protein Z946_3993 [Sulfitobacter noctilucicola]|uniref:Uncharacterized protein YjiS (DUF1127 family) n=1 Tax=Sulfitobacter noctilucicola TaxID=1342301 RepID=A0A7W6Q3M6_9RHOB|nr:hypothetical protein [Sulfitobacter noctilucicola]KIN65093.1 hypothetical protein Z946_3993 [Sulfitobacter noctilucicola]MBB4173768.1 uncharacterized protein YjiS (DUF1127 family) [Sulfitobacter noctilucicola]
MASNIETIRAAEALVPTLQKELLSLRTEAMEDGTIDAEEQVEIDRVEGKITSVQDIIAQARTAWETNKAEYERLRTGIEPHLPEISECEKDELSADKKNILDGIATVDQTVEVEDFAAALDHIRPLAQMVTTFIKLHKQMRENDMLAELSPEELADVSLIEGDTADLFSEEYMNELAVAPIPGEGSPDLRKLMAEIDKGVTGPRRAEVMVQLSSIVGDPPSNVELDTSYTRFLVLRQQQELIGKENCAGDMEQLDPEKHPEFGASRSQLMFGKVLGEAFGIHEVFGALLSPTGGLVGPGNQLIPGFAVGPVEYDGYDSPHLDPDHPVALHGTVHDAAGYLKSFHNEGPGYNYRDNPVEACATAVLEMVPFDLGKGLLPLTGQASGVVYWTLEAGDEYIEVRMDAALVEIDKELDAVYDQAADIADELINAADDARQDLSDTAEEYRREAEAMVDQAERDLTDLVRQAEADALGVRDAVQEGIESAEAAAVETYDEAMNEARLIEEAAREKLDAVANFIWG